MISGIPCRFKYTEVDPDNFGFTTDEILDLDDKELNRRASFKKVKTIYETPVINKYNKRILASELNLNTKRYNKFKRQNKNKKKKRVKRVNKTD